MKDKAIDWLLSLKNMFVGSGYHKYIDLAVSALQNDKWVSVNEELPTYGNEVLTVLKDGEMCVNWVIEDEDPVEWFDDGVVAWRPLPRYYGAQ